jgi:hypothetical protein
MRISDWIISKGNDATDGVDTIGLEEVHQFLEVLRAGLGGANVVSESDTGGIADQTVIPFDVNHQSVDLRLGQQVDDMTAALLLTQSRIRDVYTTDGIIRPGDG